MFWGPAEPQEVPQTRAHEHMLPGLGITIIHVILRCMVVVLHCRAIFVQRVCTLSTTQFMNNLLGDGVAKARPGPATSALHHTLQLINLSTE